MTKNNESGNGTPSSRLKSSHTTGSFRDHVREQLDGGNVDAIAWQKNKGGDLNKQRSEKAEARIYAEKLAKKAKAAKK